jgi:hypothetical protein
MVRTVRAETTASPSVGGYPDTAYAKATQKNRVAFSMRGRVAFFYVLRFVSAWYTMRNTAAPMTATTKLYRFNPVTPGMPNTLNSQPPATAPTMPKTISNNIPSPDLLMSLLARNPATNPEDDPGYE